MYFRPHVTESRRLGWALQKEVTTRLAYRVSETLSNFLKKGHRKKVQNCSCFVLYSPSSEAFTIWCYCCYKINSSISIQLPKSRFSSKTYHLIQMCNNTVLCVHCNCKVLNIVKSRPHSIRIFKSNLKGSDGRV